MRNPQTISVLQFNPHLLGQFPHRLIRRRGRDIIDGLENPETRKVVAA